MYATKRPGFGLVPIAGAVESAIASEVSGLLSGESSGEQENLQDNAYMYGQAISTKNPQWLLNLATVSGQAGEAAGIAGAGNPSTTTPWRSGIGQTLLGGWGSAGAQADAVTKYQAAVKIVEGTGSTTPSNPLAAIFGTTTTAQAGILGGLNLTTLTVVGVGAWALSKVFGGRRRR